MKPDGFEISFKYTCKHCDTPNWISMTEAEQLGRIVCLFCNRVIKIDPIKDLKLKLFFDKAKSQPKNVDCILSDAIPILTNYGYSADEVKRFVNNRRYDNIQALIKDFLKHYEGSSST